MPKQFICLCPKCNGTKRWTNLTKFNRHQNTTEYKRGMESVLELELPLETSNTVTGANTLPSYIDPTTPSVSATGTASASPSNDSASAASSSTGNGTGRKSSWKKVVPRFWCDRIDPNTRLPCDHQGFKVKQSLINHWSTYQYVIILLYVIDLFQSLLSDSTLFY